MITGNLDNIEVCSLGFCWAVGDGNVIMTGNLEH